MLKTRQFNIFCSVILISGIFLMSSCDSASSQLGLDYVWTEAQTAVSQKNQNPVTGKAIDPNIAVATQGPLKIDIQKAIFLSIENNQSLIVERMNPQITGTFENEELAVFDPILKTDVSNRRIVSERLSRAGSDTETSTVDSINGLVSLAKLFPTGTNVELSGSTAYTDSSLYSDTFTSNRLGLTVTQALLQGNDIRANLARVNQARVDTLISQYELRGFMEILIEQVESKFWDYALAEKQIEIYSNSLSLAEKQMNETEERITIGTLAETELAAAQAEVALRKENLINSRSTLAKEHLELLRLLNPSQSIDWNSQVVLEYDTTAADVEIEPVEQHVQVAMKMRPDLNQAKLQIKRGELEVVRTKNGLLPKMDMFISYGNTGYADTFGKAFNKIGTGQYDVTLGLILELPPVNRAARSQHSRAVLSEQQLQRALENLIQLAQVDVRSGYIEATRAREQITATAATRAFQEEKLRAETEKFRVGKSTSLLVGQAQRDLVASQIAETQAVANYLKALIVLYRLEGSLLQRRGISAPGDAPVNLDFND
jgi:outer membrane protein